MGDLIRFLVIRGIFVSLDWRRWDFRFGAPLFFGVRPSVGFLFREVLELALLGVRVGKGMGP